LIFQVFNKLISFNKNIKNKTQAFLKLIRIENLLIIALTQYLIRYCVIDSLLYVRTEFFIQKLFLQVSTVTFNLLVLSTVFIAAAGYIINDYFDVKTDRINHPETIVIDRFIKRRWAMIFHITFNAIGILLGIYVAYDVGNLQLSFIHLISAGLLWHYSTTFKKQLLIGNIIVSFLSAMVPIMVMLFELPKLLEIYTIMLPHIQLNFLPIYKYIIAFFVFAFISTLIREIIKDIEDFHGDEETGCVTIPIKWGTKVAKTIVLSLITNIILLLSFVVYKLYSPQELIPTLYIILGILIPFIILFYLILKAQVSKDFNLASKLIKFIMLVGVCFSFIIYYLSNHAA
jgi:4-hydroxybenzoate polyprenyltransferase